MGRLTHRAWGTPVVLAIAFALACSASGVAMNIYDFESLTPGVALSSQGDNWTDLGSPPQYGQLNVTTGSGSPNTTIVLEGGNYDIANPTLFTALRTNDPNWSYRPFTGFETAAYIQFDCVVAQSSNTWNMSQQYRIGGPATRSPLIEVGDNSSTGVNVPYWRIYIPGGEDHYVPILLGDEASIGDWVRVRLTMDFTDTTDGKQGSMSLSFMNLSTGAGWRDVAGLQGLDLENGDEDPTIWNNLYVQIGSSQTAPTIRIDNLVIGGQLAIPEPATLSLLALGGLGLLARRRRCK